MKKKKRLTFSSSAAIIPATHRSPDTRSQVTSSTVLRSVATVHEDAGIHAVQLRNRVDLCHSAVITAFAKTTRRYWVGIEPRILSENEMPYENCPVECERVIVACTVTTWLATDGSAPFK